MNFQDFHNWNSPIFSNFLALSKNQVSWYENTRIFPSEENPLGYSLRSLLLKGEEPCPLILAHGFLYQSNLILFTAFPWKNDFPPKDEALMKFWCGWSDIEDLAFWFWDMILVNSRVEVAVDTRRRGWSCGPSPRIRCNEVNAARSARLKGKKCQC